MVTSLSFPNPIHFFYELPQLVKPLFSRFFHSATLAESRAKRKITALAALSKEELNRNWNVHLENVTKELLSLPECTPVRGEVNKILKNLEFSNLELFFDQLVKNEIALPSAKSVEEVLKVIDVTCIEAHLKVKYPNFKGATSWASEVSAPKRVLQTAKKTGNVVTRFFPNLAHILLRAFDLFDSDRPPASLYEYGVLVTMYFHFFYIPYLVFKTLSVVIASSAMVLLTGTVILGLAVGALYVYLRWIKKCPEKVIYCENLSDNHRKGLLHPTVGREKEFREALACLNDEQRGTTVNLLIIGEPGVGKTEFMNGLAQRLTTREVYKFKNWSLIGAPNAIQSPGEKMEEAFREVKGYEQKAIFMCDELGDAKEQLVNFLKPVLNNESIQFIGAMTLDQYENLKKSDKAFEERFKPIFLQPTDKLETLQILSEKVRRSASEVSYDKEALEKIVDLSQNRGYCQPKRAIALLDEIINRIHQFKPEEYVTPSYLAAKEALDNLKRNQSDYFARREFELYLSKCEQAKYQFTTVEKELNSQRIQAKQMKELFRKERQVQKEVEGFDKEIARLLFASFFLYPALAEKAKEMAREIPADMPLRIDVSLVEKVVAEDSANRR